jgi:Bacterial Ig-like domain (group 3)
MNSFRKLCILVCLVLGVMCASTAFAQIRQRSLAGKSTAARNQAMITLPTAQDSTTSGRTVNLKFPQGTRTDSVKAVLNGKDVSDQFHDKSCSGGVCLSAVLTETDGMRDGNNVLYATAKNEDGTASSARMHFDGVQPKQNTGGIRTLSFSKSAVQSSDTSSTLPTMSSFLPPSIAFSTLIPGGAPTNGNWIQLGSQLQLPVGDCASVYSVIVLDRQTLEQKTSAPEISPRCFAGSSTLVPYLQSLAGLNDLVIVGTLQGQQTDAGSFIPQNPSSVPFDTSSIGGRAYNCQCPSSVLGNTYSNDVPQQYIAIGVPGANPGSAYETYTTSTNTSPAAAATGMLAEDASGNYNFQPSGNIEYMVQPGVTAATTTITINKTPTGPQYNVVYQPPSASANANGFWLLVLDRHTLLPVAACPQNAPNNNVIIVPNCGQYFPTGTGGNPSTIASLGPALSAVSSSQIAILTTVGTAGWSTPQQMAGTGASNGADNGTFELSQALQAFGIPDKLILETGAAGSTYTMIGVPGLGGPLNGHNILSTSYLAQQGQTGYVHGTFALDNHGMFEPAHAQQEPGLNPNSGVTTDTANLQLGLVLSQQPVEWPEFIGSPLLYGADTLSGQIDAYKYLSNYLLNNWYIQGLSGYDYPLNQGVTGPYSYDIHYFYTGSLNTSIDYHTFDPLNATYPTPTSGCGCTWENANDGTQLTFTQNDFNAVKVQLHNELVALTNVLSFFVTGSTNLKDIVAAGNSNAALALLQAFSAVQANIEQQGVALAQKAPVKVSPWHIVNMIATDISPYVSLATDGAISGGDIKLADQTIGLIGDAFKAAGGTGGGLASGHQSSTADIPRLDYSLDTTVSQLAGLGLQSQFLAGFDATLDSITGDWNKLLTLGASAVNNQALFSPTQATQNAAIAQITTAEQKSLYMSLVPSVFQVHYWNMTSGVSTVADMGYTSSGNTNSCSSFYPGITKPPSGTSAPHESINYPTYGGLPYFSETWKNVDNNPNYPFQYSQDPPYQDWYVLALPVVNGGHTNANAQVMNPALTSILFGNAPTQVNLSLDEFVAITGPMDHQITGGPSQLLSLAYEFNPNPYGPSTSPYSPSTNPFGLDNGHICSQSEVNDNAPGEGSPTPPSPPANATVTTLQAPATAVLGDNVTLQAEVVVQSTSSPAGGSVQFRDGSTVLQTVTLDATGSASYTTNTLALGQHALSASFASTKGTLPSDSNAQTLTVYSSGPEMLLSLSQASLNVSYGTTSSPISLQIQALSGMSGTVNYACTGLPVGMTCNFKPSSGAITDGGTATTSFTITATPATTSSFAIGKGWGLFSLAVPLWLIGNIRREKAKLASTIFPLLLLVLVIGSAIGCGGGSNSTSTLKDTGTKTVLISATCGTFTRSTPLIVNTQQ